MLNSLRQATKGWIAKALLLLLVLSFAVWGISGQILSGGGDVVLEAGETTVSAQQYRLAFDRVMALESQRLGTRLTREQARLLGIDNAVQARMIGSAVLDEQARVMNLGLSQDRLAELIAEDPAFQGVNRQFDRGQFRLVLREVGMSEADYIVDREKAAVRQQVVEAVADGVTINEVFIEALAQYQGQTRDVSFIEITADALIEPQTPSDSALAQFFEANSDDYRAPEYRALQYVLLTADTIADPSSIDDTTIRAEYERNRERYAQPERRTIQQIVFGDRQAAEQARQRILDGESFEAIVTETGRSLADSTLGTLEQGEVPDAAVAQAAFAISEEGGVSEIVDGAFGPILVRVATIEPEQVEPYEAVAEQIRSELAAVEARDILLDVHDNYEDARAGGASMADAAQSQRLDLVSIAAIDSRGRGPDGEPVTDLPEPAALVQAAFNAEIGGELRPINSGREGFLWIEVTDIMPDRDRSLDEVRDRVIADWQAEQRAIALDAVADAAAQAVRDGADLLSYGQENGFRSDTKFGLTRATSDADFGPEAVQAVFSVGPDEITTAPGVSDDRRLVLRIEAVTNPVGGGQNLDAGIEAQFDAALGEDLLNQLVARLQTEFPVRVFPNTLQLALDAGTHTGM